MTTSHTPDPAPAADMDPQTRAQLLRAARGIVSPTSGGVPMGIRYRTPAAPAQTASADRRPLWMTMAPTGVLEEIADTTPRPAGTTTRAAAPAPARTAASTPPPAATRTTRTRATTPATRTAATPAVPVPRAAATPPAETPSRVLARYDSWLCEVCGSRYTANSDAHGCGRLIPVTVTITTRTAGEQA